MRKKILVVFLALLLFLCALPLTVSAETGTPQKHIRVGYFTMENFMEGGLDGVAQSGFTYELICEIGVYNHWDVEFVFGDFADLYQQLTEGKIDILPNIIDTEERKEQVLFHDFMLNEEHYFISTLQANAPDAWDISALNGKKIATVQGAYEEKIFDAWAAENSVSMQKVYCDGFDDAWKFVQRGDADYILNINNTAPDASFSTLCEIGRHGVYFAVAKDRTDILSDIDYALDTIDDVSPFLIDNLKQKYLNESLSSYQLSPTEKAWIAAHPVLRIGGLANDAPYAYADQDGRVVGTYVELTDLIFEKLEIDSVTVEWSLYATMDELHAALKNGEVDLICPEYHSYYEAQQNGFAISETVMNIPMGILSLGPVDMDGIATIATGATRPGLIYVRENFPGANIVPLDSVDKLVAAVANGRAAGAIAHIYALQDVIRDSKTEFTLSPLSTPCIICYAAKEEDNAIIMVMNRGYHLIDQAERNAMEIRYATDKSNIETLLDFLRDNMLVIILVLLFVFALAAYAVNRALNAAKIKKNLEEIKKQNEIIEASRRDLETAKEEAQAADRAKTTFLFNMSHDIRTPMNAIIGFNHMALGHIDDTERVKDCLGKIDVSSQHLLSLINDVLDMARIESGTVKCEYEPTDVVKAAAELTDIVRVSMQKDLTVETDCSGVTHTVVLADRLHTDRILTNVLSNSVKYTPDGGRIRFTVRETPAARENFYGYDFIMEDTGIGMSEEFLSHIYEEFSRERTSTISGVQGTGLGMAITKKLVDLLGGSIRIKSKPGEGTETTIHLEMEAVATAVASSTPESLPEEDVIRGKKVLLVEDNELNREIAVDILTEQGMTVDTAEDGDIAVEKMRDAQEGQYDLILMDIQMPRMNGYDATRAIRKLPAPYAANIPIVAMTANAFDEDRQNALDAGMNGHTAKPIDVQELIRTLSDVLK